MWKLIDADALMTWFNDNYDDEDVSVGCVSAIIEAQPEAVVRCNNCKHYKHEATRCLALNTPMRHDGYCSYGDEETGTWES